MSRLFKIEQIVVSFIYIYTETNKSNGINIQEV